MHAFLHRRGSKNVNFLLQLAFPCLVHFVAFSGGEEEVYEATNPVVLMREELTNSTGHFAVPLKSYALENDKANPFINDVCILEGGLTICGGM